MEQLAPAVIMVAMVILICMVRLGVDRRVMWASMAASVVAAALYTAFFGLTGEVNSVLVVFVGIGAVICVNPLLRLISNRRLIHLEKRNNNA
jgi:uncharacterized membrane protein YgaE (UPF0421/DUF939 family)